MENCVKIPRRIAHLVGLPTVIASVFLALGASTYHWSFFFIVAIGSDLIFSAIYFGLAKLLFIKKDEVGKFNQAIVGLQIIIWLLVALVLL